MSGDDRLALGLQGEDLACRELVRRGYRILARRFRTRFGELDIVAGEGEVVVFVEVKTRRGAAFGRPLEAVTAWKQRRMARMAVEYVFLHGLERAPCRFDVVGIAFEPGAGPAIELIRGAFDVGA